MADESKAICNHCKTTLSRGGKNPKTYRTSNLLKHLRAHHKTIFSELQAADETEEHGQVSGKEKSLGTWMASYKMSHLSGLTTQCR